MSVLVPGDDPTPDDGDRVGAVRDQGPVVVVTALKLSRAARAALAARMGPGHVVRGIREAGHVADVVLVPAASPQLIGRLRAMFPGAKILITELTDDELGLSFGGPLQRAMDSGVDGYFVAADLDRVAAVAREVGAGGSIGALTSGADQLTRALTGGTTDAVRVHLAAGLSAAEAEQLAQELGAVRLDVADWARRLLAAPAEPAQLGRLAEVVWDLVEQILARGGAVLLDADPVWLQRAAAAGHPVQQHRP